MTAGGVVVGMAVIAEGSDHNQLTPMIERIEAVHGARPAMMLVDGGFVDREQIERAEMVHGVAVHAPVKEETSAPANYERRPHDSEGTFRWRQRMGTAEGRTAYRWRCRTAEWVNARLRNWGPQRFLVKGLEGARCSSLLYCLCHNFKQSILLRTAREG